MSESTQAPPARGKLVISNPTLIHGGEATRSLNLVDVKIAARERVNSGGSSTMTMTTTATQPAVIGIGSDGGGDHQRI